MFEKRLLFLIIILAALLRLWNLSDNPPGLTWDEASLGYNAYSLLQTGKDEYGNSWPLTLKSFGDYKPALYAYLDVPFIYLFGLNEFAVRLPSAIFGILSVLVIYFLSLKLFKIKSLALLSALMLAINPWAIQFSRPAFEANLALFLNLLGVYLLIKGFTDKAYMVISAFAFGLSLLSYQASKIFVPVIILITLVTLRKHFKPSQFKIAGLIFGIFFIILFSTTFIGGQSQRLSTMNFFAYQRSAEEIKTISGEDGLVGLSFETLHGEWFAYIGGLVERYLIYFSPKMLFIDGDYGERHRVPDLGALYYFSVVLVPLGLVYFIKLKSRESLLILLCLCFSPIPAVLSRDLISTLRALNMVVPVVILEAAGLYHLVQVLKHKSKFYLIILFALVVIMVFNFFIYLDRYFIHAPIEYSKYWLYGYSQVIKVLESNNQYKNIVFTDTYGQPYIYYLFYTKYPPEKFQKQASLDQSTVDVGTVRKIDNIEFRHVYWPGDRGKKGTLFIGSLEELPDQDVLPFPEYRVVADINFKNNLSAFRVVEIIP